MDQRLIQQCLRAVLAALLLQLAGCQLAPGTGSAPDNLYRNLTVKLPTPDALPDYQQVEQSYLASGLIAKSSEAWQAFGQQLAATPPADCLTLPWQQLQQQNLLQLGFYRLAIQCHLQHQQMDKVRQLRAYQSWIRDGILRSGSGAQSYSPWRMTTFNNALELSGLLGFSVQDYYAVLGANGNSLHYEVHVFDPLENRLKTLYFNNQRYIHAFEDTPFPFIGLADGWRKGLLPEGSKNNPALMVPMAKALLDENEPLAAEQLLLRAIERNSYQAAVLLADHCLRPQSKLTTPRARCLGLLLEAADQDHPPALELLLYLQFTKQVPTPPDWQSTALQSYINERTRPGQAEISLARFLLQKQRIGANAQQAITLLQQAATAGYPEAAAYTVLIQLEQKQLTSQQGFNRLQQLSDSGSSVAAYLYVSDLLQQDSLSAAQISSIAPLLHQSAKAGHPEAYYLLGVAAERQLLASSDNTPAAAAAYFRSAAEQYFPRAMQKLGMMYREGSGVEKDLRQASRWFYLCTRQGNAQCAFFAGVMLEDGEGIAPDPQAAVRLYQYASEQGHTGAMNRLALMYLDGTGVPADVQLGLQLLKQAAKQGSQVASYYLGVLFFEGQLVPQDLAQARQFFTQAGDYEQASYYLQNWQQLTQAKPAANKQ